MNTQSRLQLTVLLVLAAFIVAVIWVAAPRATTTLNASGTDVIGIDILGLTKQAADLPEQHFAAY